MVASASRIRLGASQLTRSATMKRLLATSLFATAAYTFTLLAGQPVANAAPVPGGVVTTPPSAVLSPATAALSDGDDIQARVIAAAQFDQLQQSALLPALTPATAALADGDDVRALGIVAVQFDQFEQPASLFVLSPASAALRDGDDIRARQLAALQH